MSTNNDLRKRAIACFATSLFLLMLSVTVITSAPSRKKGRSEEVLLFHRGLQIKGGGDTPTASPTKAPIASPTAQPTLSPPKCFDTTNELYAAVDKFMLGGDVAMSQLSATYGLPIGEWCVSGIQDFSELFHADRNPLAASFNSDISLWDVSSGTAMDRMFRKAEDFDKDLSAWDVSSVLDMRGMFAWASSFDKDLSAWDVSKVSTMQEMFFVAGSFNQDLSSWHPSSVESMRSMFNGASSFNKNIAGWDVSKVSTMSAMFEGATSFDQDLSSWNTANVKDLSHMFREASSFNQNLCSWGHKLPTRANVDFMFYDTSCTEERTPNLSPNTPGPLCYSCKERCLLFSVVCK
jgi:surface protein